MKSISNFYTDLKYKFFSKTKIDVERGSAIDMFMLSVSEMLLDANEQIESDKDPHIYTNLKGKRIDDLGILCGIQRTPNESDSSYLGRLLSWNVSNKASNKSSIENRLTNLVFSSHASFIPNTLGCGTASVYIIPKVINDDNNKNAIEEVKNAIHDVVDPALYIQYVIPVLEEVKLSLVLKSKTGDVSSIKSNITSKIIQYINGIAPGDSLELGMVNKIGIEENGVDYFIVSSFIINDKEVGDTSVTQGVKTKFIINDKNINWLEVE